MLAATPGGADGPETFDAYGGLTAEVPSAATVPGPLPVPDTDPGSHLSYAFQWWTFALGGLVAFTYMARREVLEEREGDAAPDDVVPLEPLGDGTVLWPTRDDPRPARRRAVPRRRATDPNVPHRRGGRDEDAEDALIDAQLAEAEQRASR